MSSQKMLPKYDDGGDDDYDKYDKYDDFFNLSQTVRMNTSNKTKKNIYSQKHVRSCTKKYNK